MDDSSSSALRPTIGLEIHARLLTRTKAFCACATTYGAPPNTLTCPICLGYPGTLPVLNRAAVRQALRSTAAFRCELARESRFDRKNYLYPDLPKGYQITQAEVPLATGGWLGIHSPTRGEVRIPLLRIHMEEDAGKSLHGAEEGSRIDLNRAGTPLIEVVTAPALESAEEAVACFSRIRQTLMWIGACDGNMEEGSIRCDANVSVSGSDEPGTRVEIKNLNSFRFMARAIEFEIERQSRQLASGRVVVQETRLFDPPSGTTRSMRSKEEANDYRYFPEPDLPHLKITEDEIRATSTDPLELPDERARRYREELALDPGEAETLCSTREISDLFEQTADSSGRPADAAKWVRNDVLRIMKERDAGAPIGIESRQLAELIELTASNVVSSTVARELLDEVWGTSESPDAIVRTRGLEQVQDRELIEGIVRRLMDEHPQEVAEFRGGRDRLLGFFVGRVMKETGGKADPKLATAIARGMLTGE